MPLLAKNSTSPFNSCYRKITDDPQLVRLLNAIQHTYPKPMPELVTRICCEMFRESFPDYARDYGVFTPGAPPFVVVEALSAELTARKRRGVKIYESVIDALYTWCNRNIESIDLNGAAVWSEGFRVTHTPGLAWEVITDPEEIALIRRHRNPTPFDSAKPPVV